MRATVVLVECGQEKKAHSFAPRRVVPGRLRLWDGRSATHQLSGDHQRGAEWNVSGPEFVCVCVGVCAREYPHSSPEKKRNYWMKERKFITHKIISIGACAIRQQSTSRAEAIITICSPFPLRMMARMTWFRVVSCWIMEGHKILSTEVRIKYHLRNCVLWILNCLGKYILC